MVTARGRTERPVRGLSTQLGGPQASLPHAAPEPDPRRIPLSSAGAQHSSPCPTDEVPKRCPSAPAGSLWPLRSQAVASSSEEIKSMNI